MARPHENLRRATSSRYEVTGTLHENQSTRVASALSLPNREPVILKFLKPEAAKEEDVARIRREYEILRKAAGICGVPRVYGLDEFGGGLAMVLEGIGGISLDRLKTALLVSEFLSLAVGLAATLDELHHLQITHKAICPAHIVLNRESGQFRLVGFGSADAVPELNVAFHPSSARFERSLAYISPEQTGRMNRAVDYRTDFYSLGVTFYELLTGRLPFVAEDDLGLIHCHIAIQPLPPSRCAEGIPEPLSDIVMKLLAKTAEERYQTAAGLKADLERCAAEWREQGRIAPFPLGTRDVPDRLLIPGKLYGREREVQTLLGAFDRVVKSGKAELVLVSGYAGVGKSAVVNELHRALLLPRGLFASGKFDQYKRGIPYATLAQAFGRLIDPLLGKSEAELEGWRQAFQQALEPNGQLIADLVPEIKLIIGEQSPVPELEPSQAKARFQLVFRRFLGVFAAPEHPLALFIDDLQWLDAATLDLVEDLLTQEDVRHLLLIGAYRDNEVGPEHPLMRKLKSIRSAGAAVQEITLAPLALADVTQLIADSLHGESQSAAPLAQLVYEKTAGNPFFTIQFLSALAQEGLVAFDHDEGRWSWDLNRIEAKGYTDNVADLMAGKLSGLSDTTQKALQQLACLGNVAQTQTLSLVWETPEKEVHAALQEAVRQEFLLRFDGAYRFVHDRVQEAAYSLIPPAFRAEFHLKIGRLLLAHTPEEKREEMVFEIVSQLNRGAALITAPEEREQLAKRNLSAGKRAKGSTAYAAALTYLAAGAALLAEDCWEQQHELAFALEINRAECEFLTGDYAHAEQRLTELSDHAASLLERAAVAALLMELYQALQQMSNAITAGLRYLKHLGINWTAHPTEEEVRLEYERIWAGIGNRTIEELIDLPLMSDPVSLATMDVLTKLTPPASFVDANLICLVICRAVNLSLERGNSDSSCVAYASVGIAAGAHFGDYDAGFRFGQLGYELVKKRGLNRFEARTYINFGIYALPWTKHVLVGREMLRLAFEAANRIGDRTYAAYSFHPLITNFLEAGESLTNVQREAESGLAFCRKLHYGFAINIITSQLVLVRALRGLTRKFGSFDDDQFEELRFEEYLSSNRNLALPECRYWIRKLQARFTAGDLAAAVEAAEKAKRVLWTSLSLIEVADYHFFGALCRIACSVSASADERSRHLEALAAHHKKLEIWAKHCPENFENRAALVNAEIARIEHRDQDAMHSYERAIASARENGFVQNEALAYELAAAFYRQRGFEKFARAYLTEAVTCYSRWGAEGKVRQLESLHPWLKQAREREAGTLAERLDAVSVAKAQQAISGEILLEPLARTLLRIVMENAGAQSGYLAVEGYGELRAVMQYGQEGAPQIVFDPLPTVQDSPAAILNYVRRSRETVVLSDASADAGQFSADEYLLRMNPRSILCMAIQRKDELLGVLYLENNLIAGAFTPERRTVLEMLASQAAISLETAGVHEALKESESRYRQIVATANEGIWVQERDRTTFVNLKAAEIIGYEVEEILSRKWTDFMFAEDLPDHNQRMERRRQGLREHYERRFRRKDGQTVWTLVSAAPILDEHQKYVGAFAMLTDITERKQAEEEASRLAAIVESTGDAVLSKTLDGIILSWNKGAEKIYGYTAEEVIGKPVSILLDPETRDETAELLTRVVHGERLDHYETVRRRKDGTLIAVSLTLSPVRDASGRIIGASAIARDITERKRAGEALRRLNRELRAITDCNQTLLRATDEQTLINDICRIVCEEAGYRMAWVGYAEQDEAKSVRPVAWAGIEEGYLDIACVTWSGETERGRGPTGNAIRSGKTDYTQDFTADPRLSAWCEGALQRGYRSSIALPLKDEHDRSFGALTIYSTEPDAFTAEEIRLLEELAGDLAYGIITLRTRADRERAEQQVALLRFALDNVREAAVLMDEGARFRYVNEEACRGLGYSREELLGMSVPDIDPDFPIELWQKHWTDLKSNRSLTFEGQHRTKDGHIFPVEISANYFEYGGRAYNLALVRDITERKRAEEALALRNYALNNVHEAAYLLDEQGRILYVNEECSRVVGYSREQLLQMTILEVDPDLSAERFAKHWVKLNAKDSLTFERRHRAKDGHVFPVEVSANYIEYGGKAYNLCLVRDITERKRAEQMLKESEERMRLALEAARIGTFDWDLKSDRWYASPTYYTALGYEPRRGAGDWGKWFENLHPEDRAHVVQLIEDTRAGRRGEYEYEARIRHADGSYRWVHMVAFGIERDPDGKVTRIMGLRMDITERKRAEEEQAKLQLKLQQALKMEAVGQLAGGVAHDFNNILAIINGYSETLLSGRELLETEKASLEEILAAGKRGASLTRQLLAFSRKLVLQPKMLNLNSIIEGFDKMLRRLIGDEIEVRTILEQNLSAVNADPNQMEQVLLNFCINARDAMPEGGKITIRTANLELDDATAAQHLSLTPGQYVTLSVSDTGIGIDQEMQSHIFEPFFTTKGPEHGTGLGLSTVYGIVKQSGGHVSVYSEPGQGATFRVYLPAVSQTTREPEQISTPQESLRGAETVLLVEDAAALRTLYRKILEDNGYTILEAGDGERAIQVAERYAGNIALLLSDVSLPKMKGPALARILLQQRPTMKVLFMSGHGDEVVSGSNAGTCFLQKPFDVNELFRRMREILDPRLETAP
jgi:PAS domain S-box-containing protein